jgi:hypothetical protein
MSLHWQGRVKVDFVVLYCPLAAIVFTGSRLQRCNPLEAQPTLGSGCRCQGWQGRGGAGGAGRKKSATPAGARGAAKRPGAHICLLV